MLLFVLALSGVAAAAASAPIFQYTDAELAGPEQPIQFSHRVHAGELKLNCLYCHTGADKSQHATVPAVSVCWGCHQYVTKANAQPGTRDELYKNEIAKIQQFYCGEQQPSRAGSKACTQGTSIPWVRIHNLPEHVQFKHSRHVANAKIACQECHGPIETLDRVYLVPDTVLRPSSAYLPAQKLEMGWCMNCHLQRGGTDDCAGCHY